MSKRKKMKGIIRKEQKNCICIIYDLNRKLFLFSNEEIIKDWSANH